MGWTSQYRARGTSNREFFGSLLPSGHEIVECATVKGAFYAAVRDNGTGEVSALVVLVRWSPNSDFNFTYKDMGESAGPGYYDAPARVLDALTPTGNESAQRWRERCRKELERKAKVPQVRIGDTLEFATPIGFVNGDELDTLTLVARGTFKDPTTGRRYRIPGYRNRKFRILGADA